MPTHRYKKTVSAVGVAAAIAGFVWFAWPSRILVDMAPAVTGPMLVTVDDDGKTRVRHVYTVSAPVAGKVLRISRPPGEEAVSRHIGDPVTAGETVVAIMQPVSPGFLDVRSREEIQAAVAAAEAAVNLASAEVRRIEAALEFAKDELKRAQSLARTDVISARALDKAKLDAETNEAALASAKAQLEVRRHERASIAARLIDPASATAPSLADCCVRLRAPVTGRTR
jgi:HlyD family secretion protein